MSVAAPSRGLLNMMHETDPRAELLRKVGDVSHIKVMHNHVLVAIYIRPEKTKGGLYIADKTRDEDKYQGKVGIVLATGPLAFVDDDRNHFHGQSVEPGDWIAYRIADGWAFRLNGADGTIECRMLEDAHVRMILSHPDDVY